MSRIYLIRHGKPASTWGDQGAESDPGLDETGRGQAETAATSLLQLPAHARPTRVLSSPLRRCRETAEPLSRALSIEASIEPSVAEVPTPAQIGAGERGAWLRAAFAGRWSEMRGDLDYEGWRGAMAARIVQAAPGAAVFTHFVAINALVSIALGDPRVLVFQPDHASITVLEVVSGRLRLVELGKAAATRVL